MSIKVLKQALPILVSYFAIGLACGMVLYEVGYSVVQILLTSLFIYSGAGQFLIANMTSVGAGVFSIILTISFLNVRFILMSLSSAQIVRGESGWMSFLFGTMITDETYGVNYTLFYQEGSDWTVKDALSVNLLSYIVWGGATVLGALLVSYIEIDTFIMSYGLTALFICMTVSHFKHKAMVLSAVLSAVLTVILQVLFDNSMVIVIAAVIASFIGFRYHQSVREVGEVRE
ncbi:azaleucine resistance protein AzlC [Dolosigranulum pigrum]|uniref:AzlC family ABC transporter permease n=1 Tax=Dolosigranulum pigrum TaxID=29394 RepID=UPI000DC04606|nr:AzlC family ABC transporter permease [Dolosigranulum pigrum]RAN57970.1 azaleucine resistance protein AzlC [Dolosigranulum pigrum]